VSLDTARPEISAPPVQIGSFSLYRRYTFREEIRQLYIQMPRCWAGAARLGAAHRERKASPFLRATAGAIGLARVLARNPLRFCATRLPAQRATRVSTSRECSRA